MLTRPKGLYYCRGAVGVGHPTRSLNISRSLIKTFDLDFLIGSNDVKLGIDSPHFHPISLPLKEQESLADKINERYDFLITEVFPFCNTDYKDEFEALVAKVKSINPQCLVVCSLKDSFPNSSLEKDRQTLQLINKHFDAVLVHSDARVFLLEESFSLTEELGDKVIYTGFISNPDADIAPKERQKRIVVSTGYGRFGEDLIFAAIDAAQFYPDYEFVLALGPQLPAKTLGEIKFAAKKVGADNIVTQPLISNFQEFLCESALSISLGGSTIMDVVYTKTPAIVLPSTFHDQYLRALKFSAFGFIKLITKEDLDAERLSNIIQEALNMSTPAFEVDINGSQATTREIERLIKSKQTVFGVR